MVERIDAGDKVIQSVAVPALRTADFFVLMVRYGPDYWAAHSTHRSAELAASQASSCRLEDGHEAWRIVLVNGLPVSVADGESLP